MNKLLSLFLILGLFTFLIVPSVSSLTWNGPTIVESTLNVNNSIFWDSHPFSFLASNYVPYSGATKDVNLGTNYLDSEGVRTWNTKPIIAYNAVDSTDLLTGTHYSASLYNNAVQFITYIDGVTQNDKSYQIYTITSSNKIIFKRSDNGKYTVDFFNGNITTTGNVTAVKYCNQTICKDLSEWGGNIDLTSYWNSSSLLNGTLVQTNSSPTFQNITAINLNATARQVHYGTVTGTSTSAWVTNITGFSGYFDNTMVVIYSQLASTTTTTLNINGLGTKKIYYGNTSQSSYFTAGYTYLFVYDKTKDSGNGAWTAINSYDSDSNAYMLRLVQVIVANMTIVANNIIVGNNSGYFQLKNATSSGFDITLPILWGISAITAGATGTNNYLNYYSTIGTTQPLTLTLYRPVYIKGNLSGKNFKPINSTPLTQTEPTTNDGYDYMLLGYAYSATSMYLIENHNIFQYKDGKFGLKNIGALYNFEANNFNGTGNITTTGNILGNYIETASAYFPEAEIGYVYLTDGEMLGYLGGNSFYIDDESEEAYFASLVADTLTYSSSDPEAFGMLNITQERFLELIKTSCTPMYAGAMWHYYDTNLKRFRYFIPAEAQFYKQTYDAVEDEIVFKKIGDKLEGIYYNTNYKEEYRFSSITNKTELKQSPILNKLPKNKTIDKSTGVISIKEIYSQNKNGTM